MIARRVVCPLACSSVICSLSLGARAQGPAPQGPSGPQAQGPVPPGAAASPPTAAFPTDEEPPAAAPVPAAPAPPSAPPPGPPSSPPPASPAVAAPPESIDGLVSGSDDEVHAHGEATRPPLGGIGAAIGLAFGGETLARAELSDGSSQDLNAGQGVGFSANVFVTPLWIGDSVGFGVRSEIGWKFTSIGASNATLDLTRFPLLLAAQAMVKVAPLWYLFAAGGINHDLGVTVSGSGELEGLHATLDSNVGPMAELGVLLHAGHLGMDGVLRYSSLRYSVAGVSANAENGGFFMGMYYDF